MKTAFKNPITPARIKTTAFACLGQRYDKKKLKH